MRQGILKSLTHILNSAYDWEKRGLYYKIQVAPQETIGFRKPYEKYLGTRVNIKRKMNRKGTWRTGVYTVFAQNGNPIFIAHRSWFSSMFPPLIVGDTYASAMLALQSRAACREKFQDRSPEPVVNNINIEELSWEELFDV